MIHYSDASNNYQQAGAVAATTKLKDFLKSIKGPSSATKEDTAEHSAERESETEAAANNLLLSNDESDFELACANTMSTTIFNYVSIHSIIGLLIEP